MTLPQGLVMADLSITKQTSKRDFFLMKKMKKNFLKGHFLMLYQSRKISLRKLSLGSRAARKKERRDRKTKLFIEFDKVDP